MRRLLPALRMTAEQRPGGGRQSPPAIVLRGGNRTLSLKAHGQAGGQRSGQRVVLVEAGPGCPVQQRYEVTKRLGKVDQNVESKATNNLSFISFQINFGIIIAFDGTCISLRIACWGS